MSDSRRWLKALFFTLPCLAVVVLLTGWAVAENPSPTETAATPRADLKVSNPQSGFSNSCMDSACNSICQDAGFPGGSSGFGDCCICFDAPEPVCPQGCVDEVCDCECKEAGHFGGSCGPGGCLCLE